MPAFDPITNRLSGRLRFLKQRDFLFGLSLTAITLLVYAPCWHGTMIWDDDAHIPGPNLRSWHGLLLSWTKPTVAHQYYPFSSSVFWLEYRLWGDAYLGYHLVNILLHVVCALLLFKILRRLEVHAAWLAAAIFALHPVQVESVAWMTELKTTLSGAFCLGALLIYLRFDQTRERKSYWIALALFILGLLSKSAIAPLPTALLVIFWWKRGTVAWKRDAIPLTPFFFAAVTNGLVTIWAEKKLSGAEGKAFDFSIIDRILIAARAFWFYIGKLIWPVNTGMIYRRWNISTATWWEYRFLIAALALLALLWKLRSTMRGPLSALLLFTGMLFPALGFLNINYFIFSFVADHFQYLAGAGLITLASSAAGRLLECLQGIRRTSGHGVCVAMLAALSFLSWQQCHNYSDAETSYHVMLDKNPDCWIAHTNLGNILASRGDCDEALEHEKRAVQLQPDDRKIHNSLGSVLLQKDRCIEAITQFRAAIRIRPDYAEAHNNLGNALMKEGGTNDAIVEYQTAVGINPDYGQAHENLALAMFREGNIPEAINHYQKALENGLDSAELRNNLGVALLQTDRLADAIIQYQKALELAPGYAEAHNSIAVAFLRTGRVREAIAHFQKAIEIHPGNVRATNNLAWVLSTWPDASIRNGGRAVGLAMELNRVAGGHNPLILATLAAAYAETGRFLEAVATAREALRLATSESNTLLSNSLEQQIKLYEQAVPFRESPYVASGPAH